MATTIDHLRIDHHVTVLRAFTDADGTALSAGEQGVLRRLDFDPIRLEIKMEIERRNGRKVALRFSLKAPDGPGNGRMKQYFNVGDYAPAAGLARPRVDAAARKMIVPTAGHGAGREGGPAWLRQAQSEEGPDRLESLEQQILRDAQHLGGCASVAEMYAQRMRTFQRAGNEPRAVAAFKLAVQWMSAYASQATSGGEGAALSAERDQFHTALVREFGYDPTAGIR